MSKRNFILLIIVLVIVVIAIFGFLYFRPATNTTTGENTGTNFFSQFNPFASNKTKTPPVVTPPVDVSGYIPPVTQAINAKLIKVSSMPVAGYTVFSKERLKDVVAPLLGGGVGEGSLAPNPTPTLPKGKGVTPTPPLTEFMPALRYVDRATGNIYQTFADKIEERKFSGTVIPQIYEALFGNKGLSVVMRYLKGDGRTIETFVGNIPKEYLGTNIDGTAEVKGSFLPENIEDMSLSPDAGSIFYLFNTGDNLVGATMNLTTNKKTQIFTSPFTEWLSGWGNNKTITLTTKPSSGIPGYAYGIDAATGLSAQAGKNLNKILGGINGLTTLPSPDGKLILYNDDSLGLFVYHLDTKVSDRLGLKTLPEKCVWGITSDVVFCSVPKLIEIGQYPDAWYQGEVSFSDQLWKLDLKTGNATMLLDPGAVNGGEEIDGIKLALDADENYLFFVNKKDSFLWEFGLK